MDTLRLYIDNNEAPYWKNFLHQLEANENFYSKPNWMNIIEMELNKFTAKLNNFNTELTFENPTYISLFLLKYT
jgi:hypothetical protein